MSFSFLSLSFFLVTESRDLENEFQKYFCLVTHPAQATVGPCLGQLESALVCVALSLVCMQAKHTDNADEGRRGSFVFSILLLILFQVHISCRKHLMIDRDGAQWRAIQSYGMPFPHNVTATERHCIFHSSSSDAARSLIQRRASI